MRAGFAASVEARCLHTEVLSLSGEMLSRLFEIYDLKCAHLSDWEPVSSHHLVPGHRLAWNASVIWQMYSDKTERAEYACAGEGQRHLKPVWQGGRLPQGSRAVEHGFCTGDFHRLSLGGWFPLQRGCGQTSGHKGTFDQLDSRCAFLLSWHGGEICTGALGEKPISLVWSKQKQATCHWPWPPDGVCHIHTGLSACVWIASTLTRDRELGISYYSLHPHIYVRLPYLQWLWSKQRKETTRRRAWSVASLPRLSNILSKAQVPH